MWILCGLRVESSQTFHWRGSKLIIVGVISNMLQIVVDFTASWCGPCRMISPILTEIAKKLPNILFLKVDVDELRTVSEEWNVEAMPTFVFLRDGKEVDRVVGAKKDELQNTIAKHSC